MQVAKRTERIKNHDLYIYVSYFVQTLSYLLKIFIKINMMTNCRSSISAGINENIENEFYNKASCVSCISLENKSTNSALLFSSQNGDNLLRHLKVNEFVKGPVQREHLCAIQRANTSEKMRKITRRASRDWLVLQRSVNACGCPDKGRRRATPENLKNNPAISHVSTSSGSNWSPSEYFRRATPALLAE